MSTSHAAIIGGAAGAVALVGIVIFLIWFCLFHNQSASRTSETGSSDPSVQVERNVGIELSIREARSFEMEELSQATKNFSDKNLIGVGKFGEVYKGLLQEGMLVAIKKRPGLPSQEFIDEHDIYDKFCLNIHSTVFNSEMFHHIYLLPPSGAGQDSRQKLEFKHRLPIALGAAKGLAHLHSLSPRLIHKDFKTANVLVDENFIAKVADAGLLNFLGRIDVAGPSSQVTADEIFLSPECVQNSPDLSNLSNIIDQRLGNSFTPEGMEEFIRLIARCLDLSSERRPSMGYVVMELDRTLDKEMSLTTGMSEGTPTVTLGSQLFRSTK
ncbi:hypothetical protein EZV62_020223 [Acer yangbiense]|uniref:non-specific serine/threonine protein kinase n=1 Tax=Acer yangbiense TaxID=1000413 RepID=A0A5C7HDH2_9ROSI|nr:hypothetical protein EZV62_020223 [Acer yangbiense]